MKAREEGGKRTRVEQGTYSFVHLCHTEGTLGNFLRLTTRQTPDQVEFPDVPLESVFWARSEGNTYHPF